MPIYSTRPSDTSQIFITSNYNTAATTTLSNNFELGTYTGNIFYGTPISTSTCVIHNGIYYSVGGNFINTGTQFNRHHAYSCLKAKRGPLIKKSVRSSIKKAVSLITNFGMEEDLKVFLSGTKMEISHPESPFKFVIAKKNNTLIKYTEQSAFSSPYETLLQTKEGDHIANLCVYMKETPILDQFLAFSMFIKTGNEEDLLKKANFFNITKDLELKESLVSEEPWLSKKLGMSNFYITG